MKKIVFVAPLLALCLPLMASAHQHGMFTIGGTPYSFTVGSLNEPIAVDDKTGADLTVTKGGHVTMSADGDMDEMAASEPAVGLEKTLQVELIAGAQKKVLALSPVYGKPGSYSAPFYPTVATSISYRFFGTIDGSAVDITFSCRPEGADALDEKEKDIGNGIKQISRAGGFGCPAEKGSMGFPEASASVRGLSTQADTARTYGMTGVAIGAAAIVLVFMRRKQ
jgi:hypothetical protein